MTQLGTIQSAATSYPSRRFNSNILLRFAGTEVSYDPTRTCPRRVQSSHQMTWWHLILIWTLRWRHNGRDSVSNHQPHVFLLNRLFRRRSKKTSKRRVTGLCAGNSPGTFPAQMASNAENVFIWWPHHEVESIAANALDLLRILVGVFCYRHGHLLCWNLGNTTWIG